MATLANWDFKTAHVDTTALTAGSNKGEQGNFISSESCVVLVGPAKAADLNELIPVGLVESFQIAQNKQINQIFEIGSRESYMIPGRTMAQLAISRVMFNGSSLMAALYGAGNGNTGDSALLAAKTDMEYAGTKDTTGGMIYSLASDVFNKPFGLALAIRDSDNENAAMIYCENCMMQSHQLAMQSQNLIILENVSIRCTAIKTISDKS